MSTGNSSWTVSRQTAGTPCASNMPQNRRASSCSLQYSFLDFASLTKLLWQRCQHRTVWSAFIAAVSKSQMTVVGSALTPELRWPEQLYVQLTTVTLLLSRLLTRSFNLRHCAMCLINPRADSATTAFKVAQVHTPWLAMSRFRHNSSFLIHLIIGCSNVHSIIYKVARVVVNRCFNVARNCW